MTSFSEILRQLEQKQFAPVYLLDGEEPYYIDRLLHYFEHQLLLPEERDFNLITLYGKDTSWQEVINAARRFPMFAPHTVVILKEAGQMKDLNELAAYLEQPTPSTILVIEHRFKKIDGRGKLAKLMASKGVYFSSARLREEEVPQWAIKYGQSRNLKIGDREAEMLAVFLGNDLQKLVNELDKVMINEPDLKELSMDQIEKYIGVSREYNAFDFPNVLFLGDTARLARMLQYFTGNPKAAPLPVITGSLYSYVNKVFLCYYAQGAQSTGKKLGIWEHHRRAARQYSLTQLHQCLGLLSLYSCKAVGIKNSHNDTALLQELTARMLQVLRTG